MRPDGLLTTKPATNERTDNAYVVFIHAKNSRHISLLPGHKLSRIISGQSIAIPDRGSRMRLHRIVVIDWLGISCVKDNFSSLNNVVDGRYPIGENCYRGFLSVNCRWKKSLNQSGLPVGHRMLLIIF